MVNTYLSTVFSGQSGSGEVFYPANAVTFNGSTTYLNKTAALIGNPLKGIMSFWFKTSSLPNGTYIFNVDDGNGEVTGVHVFSGILILGFIPAAQNSGIAGIVNSISTYADNNWHHLLYSWDNPNNITNVLIDGTNVNTPGGAITGIADGTNWNIGRRVDGTGYYSGSLAELFIATGNYYDLSILANVRKFLTASKRPAFLGNNGSLPTGSQPEVYMKGLGTGFNINSGSGGNFTSNGVLATPTTTPSGNTPTTNNRYWVGGTGSWNGTATGKWAYYSGSPAVAPEPTSTNNVFFDAASGTVTVTIATTTASCNNLDFTGFTGTLAGSTALQIAGSLTLAAGMTRTYTGGITLNGTSTGNTITTNGKSLAGALTVNGVGGVWQLQDNLSLSGTFTLSAGTFDTNSKTVGSTSTVTLSGSGIRSLILGTTTWTATQSWDAVTTTNFTLSASSSTIVMTNTAPSMNLGGGGGVYGTISMTAIATSGSFSGAFSGNTINTLILACTGYAKFTINNQTTITVATQLTLTGGNATTQRLLIDSGNNSAGSTRTLTVNGATTLTNVDFRDITIAGTAAPVSGTSIGNCGRNSGITFTPAVTRYWVHPATATQTILDNNWSASSGGATGASVPLPQDTMIFDASSFSAGSETVQIGLAGLRFGIMNWTGATNSPTLSLNTACEPNGSIILISGMTVSGSSAWSPKGGNTMVITSAGKTLPAVNIGCFGASFTLGDDTTFGVITMRAGTFDDGGFNPTLTSIDFSGVFDASAIVMGTGTTWSLNGTGTVWSAAANNVTFTKGTATIKLINSSASTKTFAGGGLTYYNYWNATGSTGIASITGNNTFNNIKADAGRTLKFGTGSTNTFASLTATGSLGNTIPITTTSTTFNLVCIGSNFSTDWNVIDHCAFSGATWHAGANSTDAGNNSGIIFP